MEKASLIDPHQNRCSKSAQIIVEIIDDGPGIPEATLPGYLIPSLPPRRWAKARGLDLACHME